MSDEMLVRLVFLRGMIEEFGLVFALASENSGLRLMQKLRIEVFPGVYVFCLASLIYSAIAGLNGSESK